ncbi:MAG: caspase family protein [Bacteroidota bacterium]
MKGALVVGIDYYKHHNPLYACSKDARKIRDLLSNHYNGFANFDVDLEVSESSKYPITREFLRNKIESLFSKDPLEVALFYFSGHGYIEQTGGYLATSEARKGHQGLSMSDIMKFVRASRAGNKIIILDCCYSGALGQYTKDENYSNLPDNTVILTASGADEFAVEAGGSSLFTALLLDALEGSAADLSGHITPGSLYTHVDQSLGALQQRPIFKANVKRFISLRKSEPPIPFEVLKRIADFFENPDAIFPLDPSFEITEPSANPANVEVFKILQKLNRVNLVRPLPPDPYMYFAAVNSGACALTVLGRHYWNLIRNNRLKS